MAAIGMRVAEQARPAGLKNGPRAVPCLAQAADVPDGFWYSVKRRVLGPPLVTEQLTNQRLSRPLALGVLSCDGLSSAAATRSRLRPSALRAVHFTLDSARADKLQQQWLDSGVKIPLDLADCPDRRLSHAAAQLAATEAAPAGTHVTVILPRRSYSPLTGRLLHDHTADRIARRVSRVHGASAMIIPFDARHKVDTLHARRSGQSGQSGQSRDYERPVPPDGTDPIGSLRSAGPRSRAACTRPRSGRPSTTPCWPARSPTPPAT